MGGRNTRQGRRVGPGGERSVEVEVVVVVVGVALIPGLSLHWAKGRGAISEKGARGLGLALLAGGLGTATAGPVEIAAGDSRSITGALPIGPALWLMITCRLCWFGTGHVEPTAHNL